MRSRPGSVDSGMNRRVLLLALGGASAALVSAPARRVLACACCADEGTRVEGEQKLEGWMLGELRRVRFGATARLRTGDGEMADYAKGIREPADSYQVALTRATDKRGEVWTLAFRDAAGRSGTLGWVLPRVVEELSVDPRDGQSGKVGGPLLYKELRLRMPVDATGVFEPGKAGGAGMTARLVLQGRGNRCMAAEQLTHWSLAVSGPRAGYLFFGTLVAPASRP
jgi:hypothetical protein